MNCPYGNMEMNWKKRDFTRNKIQKRELDSLNRVKKGSENVDAVQAVDEMEDWSEARILPAEIVASLS